MTDTQPIKPPEYLIADWDESGNARYALVGIKTLNKSDNDLIMGAFNDRFLKVESRFPIHSTDEVLDHIKSHPIKPLKEIARELSAKLLPHTTSSQNVTLITEALTAAEQRGAEQAKKPKEAVIGPDGLVEAENLYWKDQTIRIEGYKFINCRFDNCKLETGFIPLQSQVNKLREALEFYANPNIYKPHPHGIAFDDRDLSFKAKSCLSDTAPMEQK